MENFQNYEKVLFEFACEWWSSFQIDNETPFMPRGAFKYKEENLSSVLW
jgi:hypothetical protein